MAESQRQKPPEGGFRGKSRRLLRAGDQAVSPKTDTVTSTTTSVCRATLTVLSLTTLIGPLGRRTWALATL